MTNINPANAAATTYVPTWHEIEACKPFYRDAGRALIARLLNFEVAWVSVDAKVVNNDPAAIAEGFGSGHPDGMSNFDVHISPIIKKQGALSKHDKKKVIDYCSLVLAGPYVIWCIDPDGSDFINSVGSREKLRMILSLVEPNLPARDKLFDAAGSQVSKLIVENDRALRDISCELFKRRTLTGKDVDSLIESGLARTA